MSCIGEVYIEQGKICKAEEALNEAHDIFQQYGGEYCSSLAVCYSRFGYLKLQQQRYEEAKKYVIKALNISEANTLGNKTEYFVSLNHMARITARLGYSYNPFSFIEKARNLNKDIYPNSHPEWGRLSYTIGNYWYSTPDDDKALNYYNESLETYLHFLGELHPKVANNYFSIGQICYRKQVFSAAIEYYEKARSIWKECYSDDYHPNVLMTYYNMALSYKEQDEFYDAQKMVEKSLDICFKLSEEGYKIIAPDPQSLFPTATECYWLMVSLLDYQGKSTGAEIYAKDCLDLNKKHFGEKSKQVGDAYRNLGIWYIEHGEMKKALDCCISSCRILDKKAVSFENIMMIFLYSKNHESAELIWSKYIQLLVAASGKDSRIYEIEAGRKNLLEKNRYLQDTNYSNVL